MLCPNVLVSLIYRNDIDTAHRPLDSDVNWRIYVQESVLLYVT